jgi:ribonuclease HI
MLYKYSQTAARENGVGDGIAIFIRSEVAHELRYTLHNRWSNNQAEQLSIVKVLGNYTLRMISLHTDSRIAHQSLKNTQNDNYLLE